MRKTRAQKGITLIALIITIVVLLILAAVAISSITNDGILSYATNAAKEYNQAVANEQEMLNEYVNFLNNGGSGSGNGNGNGSGGGTTQTVATVKNTVLSTTSNTDVYDAYGNKIVVPAGFKIRVDSTTNNADAVTEGIVIEDGTNGNQFVWIPVGKIYTDTEKTEANAKTITLGRYSSFTATDGGYIPDQTAENYATETRISSFYTEDTADNYDSSYGNSIARNIGDFVTSVTTKGGYYLGRYEAGNSSDTLVCKAEQRVYNNVTQPTSSSLAQGMYRDGYSDGTFSSDLINSYAWDTAIIFIQTFGTKSNSSTYASTIGQSSTDTSAPQTTGTNILNATKAVDEQLNIYDMAGNCWEWSTETKRIGGSDCVYRGGWYGGEASSSRRMNTSETIEGDGYAFRILLYVGL